MYICNTYNFGYRLLFGITFEIPPAPKDYRGSDLYGSICYWIDGKCIGDMQYGTDLGYDARWALEQIHEKKSFQCSQEIFHADAQHIIRTMYIDFETEDDEPVEMDYFGFNGTTDFRDRFMISPHFPNPLDVIEEHILYFEYEKQGRLIVGKYDSEKEYYVLQHEFFLDAGEVMPVIQEAYEWLQERYEKEKETETTSIT